MTHLIALLAAAAVMLSPVPKDRIDIDASEENGTVTVSHFIPAAEYSRETPFPDGYAKVLNEDGTYVTVFREYPFGDRDTLNGILSSLSYGDIAPEKHGTEPVFARAESDISSGIFYSADTFSASLAPPPEGTDVPEITVTVPENITEIYGGSAGNGRAFFDGSSREIAFRCEQTAYGTISVIVICLFAAVSVFALIINTKRKNRP